mgnify:CR=1 FL=1
MIFNRYTTNTHGKHTRNATLHGREYIVAPVVMLVEGVHSGSMGPLYYPPEEMQRAAMAWNMKPVVMYHPVSGSATTLAELEARMVGMVMNTRWDGGKLRAEAWFDVERLHALAPEITQALANNEPIEVSTGLYHDADPTPGTWNGEAYQFVARNHRPDHLALLPNGVGACRLADGCGLLQLNEEQTKMKMFNADPTAHTETPLLPPTMNFGTGCGCGTGLRDGGGVAPVVAPQPSPVPNAQRANNSATGGNQGGETPLIMPPSI